MMRPEVETDAPSAEASRGRLLARWDAHLAARGVCAPRQEDFVSFGSASKLEKLRAALNTNRPEQLGCIRLALRQKRSDKWRRTNPVKETAENQDHGFRLSFPCPRTNCLAHGGGRYARCVVVGCRLIKV